MRHPDARENEPEMKVIYHHTLSPVMRDHLQSMCPSWMKVIHVAPEDTSLLARELADTDVLLHVLSPVTDQLLAQAPRLRLVQKIGVGINTIDLDAARRRGVRVANMPGTNSQAVCEMALGLMLAAMRRLPALDAGTRRGEWYLSPQFTDDCVEISGKTVGLLGYGAIPQRLAPVLKALGAAVISHSKSPVSDGIATSVSFDELLEKSDVLSLHVPLTPDTERVLNRMTIARLKRGVVIVNTARGALIDEQALLEALHSGHVRAAGLDVFAVEPVGAQSPLLSLPNVVVSPHVSWLTQETLLRSFEVVVENCRRLKEGDSLLFAVDA
jgi:phosphoglycerate dehydrogenase-like enzyme